MVGTLPEWLAAIGNLLAFAVALAPQTTETSGPVSVDRVLYFGMFSLAISIAFRDSQGYSWLREPNGC
jgi:hypothetical protein